jgi:hypothetical protein
LNSLTLNKKNKLIIPHKKQTKLKIIEEKQFFNFETFHEKLQNKSFTCDKIHITEKCQIVENKIKQCVAYLLEDFLFTRKRKLSGSSTQNYKKSSKSKPMKIILKKYVQRPNIRIYV